MRTLARRGLSEGATSAAFTVDDLHGALQRTLFAPHNVYMELDSSGQLCGRGGAAKGARAAEGGGAPEATLSARLSPSAPGAHLLLCATPIAQEPHQRRLLRLRLQANAAPLQELQLWFDDTMLALIDMPVLSLHNIQGKKNYVCLDCGLEFEQPNPLKVHMFLSCCDYSSTGFWEKCCERLERSPAGRVSAFRPYGKESLASAAASAGWSLLALPAAEHAAVEALATAWGGARGAHACIYCGKLYSRKYGLKIHIRTHTGYKPLRCRYCLRAFGDPSNLNKHMRLHATRHPSPAPAHPYSCPRCAKPLARRRDLERHMRARHNHSPPNTPQTSQLS